MTQVEAIELARQTCQQKGVIFTGKVVANKHHDDARNRDLWLVMTNMSGRSSHVYVWIEDSGGIVTDITYTHPESSVIEYRNARLSQEFECFDEIRERFRKLPRTKGGRVVRGALAELSEEFGISRTDLRRITLDLR